MIDPEDLVSQPVGPIAPVTPPTPAPTGVRAVFAAMAPGAAPYKPEPPKDLSPIDHSTATLGFKTIEEQMAARLGSLDVRAPDELDRVLARHMTPHLVSSPELLFGLERPAPAPDNEAYDLGSFGKKFWDGVKLGVDSNTLPGMFSRWNNLKSQIHGLPGGLTPTDGFDPFSDERLAQPGFADKAWMFAKSRSLNENTQIMWQLQERQMDAEAATSLGAAGGAGNLAGSFVDPTMALPVMGLGGKVAAKSYWGVMWRATRAGASNAAVQLAVEAAKSEMDTSYQVGLLDALELPAAIGFGVGLLHAGLAKHGYNIVTPPQGGHYEGRAGGMAGHTKRGPFQFDPAGLPLDETGKVFPPGALRHTEDFDQFQDGNGLKNPDGSPRMVYHATYGVFDEFDNGKLGAFTGAASAKEGHFFAGKPTTSDGYVPDFASDAKFPSVFEWVKHGIGLVKQRVTPDNWELSDDVIEYNTKRHFQKMGGAPNMRPTYIRMTNPYVIEDLQVRSTKAADVADGTKLTDMNHVTWVSQGGKWKQTYNIHDVPDRPVERFADSIEVKGADGKMRTIAASEGERWDGKPGFLPSNRDIDGNTWVVSTENGKTVWSRIDDTQADKDAHWYKDPSRTTDEITHVLNDDKRNIVFTDEIKKAKELGHDGVVVKNTKDGLYNHKAELDDIFIVFDPKTQIRGFDQRWSVDPMTTTEGILATAPAHPLTPEGGIARSMGAAVAPGMAASHLPQLLNAESLQETGLGIEKLPMNPFLRLMQSASLRARQLASEMVDSGGLKLNKNTPDAMGNVEKTGENVEAATALQWKLKAMQALTDIQQAWLDARKGLAAASAPGDVGAMGTTAINGFKATVRDWIKRDGQISFDDFESRVGRAARRGDKDMINDMHTPHVEAAAHAYRRYEDALFSAASHPEVDLFNKAAQRTIDGLKKEIAALTVRGGNQVELNAAQVRLALAEKNALDPGKQFTAMSYFGRLYNRDVMTAHAERFKGIVARHLMNGDPKLTELEALDIARNVHSTAMGLGYRTVTEAAEDIIKHINDPGSVIGRTLQIPDTLIEDFLESSPSLMIQHKLATLAPAIELTRRFGDTSMSRQIDNINADYAVQHAALTKLGDTDGLKALNVRQKRDVEDVLTLRDRLLNVAGASADPHSWDQRTIRMAKHYMVWTTMGLSAFSQLGDLFRPAITEGLDAVHRYGFATLMSDSRKIIMNMAHEERIRSGDSYELVHGTKALAASDIGDTLSSRSQIERKANKATSMFYMLNGMNLATDLTKDWGSVIIQGKFNDALSQWALHGLGKGPALDPMMMERLLSLGIDGNDALRMHMMLETHGAQFKSIRLASSEAWTDKAIRDTYRQALQRALARTVITPGAADRSNWMTTAEGSLISQFRTFGQSSTIRTLAAGLQEGDRNFWTGAAVLTGGAIVLNELRNQLFYDRSSFDQPYLGILADGVDRSGVLGSFMDINNALETASNNKLGMRPIMGAGKTIPTTPDRMANTFLGPAAGKTVAAADQLGKMVQGDFSARTWRGMRQFVPVHRLPQTDLLFDHVFPGGNPGRKASPAP